MAFERSCENCDCAARVGGGRPDEWVCANHPEHAGQLTLVAAGGVRSGDVAARCRSFRRRRESAASAPAETEGIRHIGLTEGLFAIVDAADYEWLRQYHWRGTLGNSGYACCAMKGKTVFMHRFIMNPPAGMVVDHINGHRWDNRRRNLRVCTRAENLRNTRKSRGTSRFKGVYWDAQRRKWGVRICRDGNIAYLGRFADEVEAAQAYDRAAAKYFGQYACLNFPDPRSIVWLSGRIGAHCHARGRAVRKVRQNMPTRSVGMAPGRGGIRTRRTNHRQADACRCHPGERCCSRRGTLRIRVHHCVPSTIINPKSSMRGIRPRREGTSSSEPDASTALRGACPERSRRAQHDKDAELAGIRARWSLRYIHALVASRGPPGWRGKRALEAPC